MNLVNFMAVLVTGTGLMMVPGFLNALGSKPEKSPLGLETVRIDTGLVRGKVEDGIRQYFGIPYAAPPVGDFRWKPPRKVALWKDVRSCTQFGPSCPQPPAPADFPDEAVGKMSEDCLYLNIWTPAEKADANLPVMVWIHGGGFFQGSGSMKSYSCQNLAKMGVVAVNINYRLGALGFLAHQALSKESPHGVSGNYGLLDQTAALQWVRRNISAFGGDPDNVTIFGESAGAVSVTLHTLIPFSRGLFHGVIAESGNPYLGVQALEPLAKLFLRQAEKTGVRFAEALGCNESKDVLACLRKKTPDELLKVSNNSMANLCINSKGFQFGPIIDGWVFPDAPMALYDARKVVGVPMIIGTNADEGNRFTAAITGAQYKAWVEKYCGKYTDKVLAEFSPEKLGSAEKAYYRFMTIFPFQEPARYVAGQMAKMNPNAYLYVFSRVPDTEIGRKMKACHGIELPYVFGLLDKKQGYGETDFALSKSIMKYWTNFAKRKNPNSSDLPDWPKYNRKTDRSLDLGDKIRAKESVDKKACDLIEKVMVEDQKQLQKMLSKKK